MPVDAEDTGLPGYTLEEKIHEGRRTHLYRGHRTADMQPVVIKTLKGDPPSPRELASLRHEYGILRELSSPAVVEAYALEKTRGGLALVMEPMEGRTLRAILKEGRLPLRAALLIALAIADAIGAVHRCNITHKDIKPDNIVVSHDLQRATLIDFGLATRLTQEPPQSIRLGALEGTLAYMSPEQTGRMNRGVDPRSDLYSFGVTLHEMLTGSRPFSADDPMEVVYSHIARQPVPPYERQGDVPRTVSDIVMKLLAKTPEDRYQSTYGVHADLAECLRDLEATGLVHPFPVGRRDRSYELRIPQTIYGRDAERGQLLEAFDRVRAGAAEFVLISGYSGVGKSALVRETQKAIVRGGGYFADGKFDQFQRAVPCASLAQAFRELVRQILAERTESLARWRAELRAALGGNAGVVVELIPELELVIGPAPPAAPLGPSESQNRFDMVFRNFLRVFATEAHPLVLLLDDLHWADPASLRLLRYVLNDPEMGHLLVVGAYRDNEVSLAHPLMITLDAIRKAGAAVTDIPLAPLSVEDVSALLDDALGADARDMGTLSALIHEKTQGNPFFIGQFLRTLSADELLRWDPEAGRWVWDLAAIEARGVTDNVVDFMIAKLQRLSPDTQRILRLAACIGHRFDLHTLATIDERPATRVAQDLWEALREGIVLPLSPEYRLAPWGEEAEPKSAAGLAVSYQFLHDRVQQAAYALIADAHKREVHLRIGRLMLASQGGEPREDQLFDVANHFIHGSRLVTDPDEREALARLCLRAGRKAKASTAYSAASEYLETGRRLLGEDGEARDDGLGFALTLEAAECDYLCGRFGEAEGLFSRALGIARSSLERARVYSLRMKLYQVAGRYSEGVRVGQEGLSLFGISLPEPPEERAAAFAAEVAQIPGNMAGRSIEELLDAPPLSSEDVRAAINLLVDCAPCAYIGRPEMFPLIALKMLNLSLRHGTSEASCFACSVYGFMLVSVFGDIPSGYRFSEMSIRLNERLGDIALRGSLLHLHGNHVNFWVEHIRNDIPILERAFLTCLEAGDLAYASYLAFGTVWQLFEKGDPLAEVHRASARFASFARNAGNETVYLTIRLKQQFLRSFQGLTRADAPLSEEGFDEEECLSAITRASFGCGVAVYHIMRLILFHSYGRPEEALASAEAARPSLGAVMAMPIEATYHFYYALTLIALRERAGNAGDPGDPGDTERQRREEALSESTRKLEHWAQHCPDNFRVKHLLVLAELARASGRDADAMELYDAAIDAARGSEFPHYEALSSELAGKYYARKGRARIAALYVKEARRAYRRWGADRKVAELGEEHGLADELGSLESPGPVITSLSTVTGGDAALDKQIDVAAALRTTQAISSELVLEKALDRVMRALLSSAGAERGFLVLDREGQLVVEAAITMDPETVDVGLRRPLEGCPDLPVSVVQYVTRTRELVLLDAADASLRFAADPYLLARRPRSVMCLPLIHQGRLTGALYVENALASGTFSPERAELLRLLCGQVAVSLENALLYGRLQGASEEMRAAKDRLEVEVERRTREIFAANERLSRQAEELDQVNARLVEELGERERAERARAALQEEIIHVQRARIAEMATPVIPITDRIIVMPLIGTMGTVRAEQVLEAALAGVRRHRPEVVIIDVTGLRSMDAGVAETLLRTASALRLIGAQAMLTGMRPESAQAIVELGLDLSSIPARLTLESGIASALARSPRRARA